MCRDRLDKFDKTEHAWSDIALFGNKAIIGTDVVAFLLIAGFGYYVFEIAVSDRSYVIP